MIVDAFLYNGEKECLEIRINELKDVVDYFVIVEGAYTFTGKPKNIHHDAGNIANNIIHCVADAEVPDKNPWVNETRQRNYIKKAINWYVNPYPEDVMIVGDVDEIPRAEAIKSYDTAMGLTSLQMDIFWYRFNCLAEKQTWTHPRIMPWTYLKDKEPDEVRRSGYPSKIENAGWHFSYLGNEDFIINKLESFSHQEYNTPAFKDRELLRKKTEQGESIWGQSQFQFVGLDATFPKYLVDNKEKFKHLIHQV